MQRHTQGIYTETRRDAESMKKSISTVLEISIHQEGDNPVFGEGSTRLRIEDEAGGGFFVISQPCNQEIKLNPDELYFLAEEGKKIMDAYKAKTS